MTQSFFIKRAARVLLVVGIGMLTYFFTKSPMAIQDQNAKHEDKKNADLTEEQRYIIEDKGTEPPFTSELLNEKRKGTYYAADTKEPVFRSEDKFDSGTGWPSFTKPIDPEAVEEHRDVSHGMIRTEVTSSEGGHLGHVFTDGPEDKGGLRYCINGDALYFVPDEETGEGQK